MSKNILGIGLAIVGAALIFTGVGAPLGLGTIGIALGGTAFISDAVLIGLGLEIAGSFLMGPGKPKGLTTSPTDRLTATLVPTEPRKIAFGHTALPADMPFRVFTR